MADKSPGVAVVGAGYWGKHLVRNFYLLGHLEVCCDSDETILAATAKQYPGVRTTTQYAEVLKNDAVEGVALAVPAQHHYGLAAKAIEAGKHIFVEKPIALRVKEAERLIEQARRRRVVLMVGHLLLYHPAVGYLKGLVESNGLGEVYYIYSQRVNLGKVRQDENALWSLAPHDISIILYLFDAQPESVSARGGCYIQRRRGIEDVVFVNLLFPRERMANVHLSWLDPHKVRRTTVVGSRKMAVFDDMEPTEKIRIYDMGIDHKYVPGRYDTYGDALTLRTGDIVIPKVDMQEPLRLECQHFVDCIVRRRTPLTDGEKGLAVLRVLAAAQKSLRSNGRPVSIDAR